VSCDELTRSTRAGTVAIVITTYNHAPFLRAAIESALAQVAPASEIIVVDDGSDDRPDRIAAEFPDVLFIRQHNQGLSAARNTGWRAAHSDYVVFLDADDRLLADALRVNLELLAATPEAGFSYGGYLNVQSSSGLSTVAPFAAATEGFGTFLLENVIGMHGAVMYRRDKLAEVGGFEEGLAACEDYDVFLKMALRFPVVYSRVPLAQYWHHGGNMSRDSAMMLRYALYVLGRQRSTAEQLGLLRAYRTGVANLKRHYVRAWCLELVADLRSRSIGGSMARQAASLVRQAPLTVIGTPVRVVRQLARDLRLAVARRRSD
jgi:GT2 family glycosyltransferase